jgi:uncharacterized cupredoxin-like copper-binding protein
MRGIRIGSVALSALVAMGIGAFVTTHAASAQPAQQASTRMTLTLSDYSIMNEVPSVPAGDVTFDVVNTGDEVHELVVFKSDKDAKALPMSATDKDAVDEDAVGEFIGSFEEVQPATGANGTLVLAPGHYILLCNLSKHYGLGMVSTLDVN